MDNFVEKLPGSLLSIRVNIDKENMQDYQILQKELLNRWKGKNVRIYPGILRIDDETGTALACNSINREESNEFHFQLIKDKMSDDLIYPELTHNTCCCANSMCAYVIGSKGEIYKCWNDVGNERRIIGFINEDNLTNPDILYQYMVGTKWYHNKDCLQCFYLPICHGICAWYRLRNQYENGKYNMCQCIQKTPEMLEKCLEEFYYNGIR